MKMEFDEDVDAAADGSEVGLAARLTKKIKKEPVKDKSKITCTVSTHHISPPGF